MPFHLDLTLQQRAAISLATSIWNRQIVKNKISKWSHNLYTFEYGQGKVEWRQLMEVVLKEVNGDLLPPLLRGGLIHVVKALGEKIFNWCQYINRIYYNVYKEHADVMNYIGEIYWTPIGTIDEVKILQSYWLKNSNLKVAVLYNIACKNALEEDIDDLWQNMPCSIKDCNKKFNRYSYDSSYEGPIFDYLILAYWKYRRGGQLDDFPNFVLAYVQNEDNNEKFVYNTNYSLNQNMFFLSVYKCYNTAVKYFWNKLTQEERDNSILYSAYISVVHTLLVWQSKLRGECIKEKYLEIMIFLINQMTLNQKESFLRLKSISDEVNYLNIEKIDVKGKILLMLLSIWPWQELFIPALNDTLQYLDDDTKSFSDILLEISCKMDEPSDVVDNSRLQSLLCEVWFKIPRSIKRMMIQNLHDDFNLNFMDYLLGVGDFDNIKMIFDDPEIVDLRRQFIEIGVITYRFLIESNDYELLNQFMEEILRSEEEKICFKSVINHIDVCKHFVLKRKYDSVDKLLNWKFETIKERKECKDYFKNHVFFIDFLITTLLWCEGSVDKAKEESSRFLEWLLESEDDIACFKKQLIVNCEPLNEKQFVWEYKTFTLSEEEAQKIRQILA